MGCKMSPSYLIVFFVALSFCLSVSITEANLVKVHSAMPDSAAPMKFTCVTQAFQLSRNDGLDHDWTVDPNSVELCRVTSGSSSASFNAFDVSDKGHGTVFWRVQADGFWHSWDFYAAFEKKANWTS